MAFLQGDQTNQGAYSRKYSIRPFDTLDTNASMYLMDDRQSAFRVNDTASLTPGSSSNGLLNNIPRLGKPTVKKIFYASDMVIAAISTICCTFSIIVVANESISWRLGTKNNQLIIVGFLISIMNMCLTSVAPILFISLENRFGSSTIQNYDAILRNMPLAPGLSVPWRAALSLMIALPIGLSVLYKTFIGGYSVIEIKGLDYISNATFYGMFLLPGQAGVASGNSLFFNATQEFLVASNGGSDNYEPPLPAFPDTYGHNVLLLNDTSTAMLDTLNPEYLSKVQELLAIGESWAVTAPVIGTVATRNESKTRDPTGFSSDFITACELARDKDDYWTFDSSDLYNHWSFFMMDRKLLSDQSTQYIGLSPNSIDLSSGSIDCEALPDYVYLFNIYRQPCKGTWSITRGGYRLVNASCDEDMLPWSKQQVIANSILVLPIQYISSFIGILKTYSGSGARGNQSVWMNPSMSTAVAAMMWSQITAMKSEDNPLPFDSTAFNMSAYAMTAANRTRLTQEESGTTYPVSQDDQSFLYTRPTLQKSYWLYLVFAFQPVLIFIILGTTATLYSTPLGRGFGLVSILSGIDPQNLDSLIGASFSGVLEKPVKLDITPINNGPTGSILYRMNPSSEQPRRNGKLIKNLVYH
ncbi:hypothetical protein PFICI_04698 [Pestalotiopsis fici W106-1]|uniref:Uncharacterized protein n=1 Tax=Pestalotiopsis fici (strain W106-1 / CGMCC3.15140) TaxID=1229662 RepID=W3XBM1_PESFW|nr:uncharacterized protein PFICI_04698 [Pestalotiopsis fici W106-1]ETS82822.1 hypothetical protein PFICI_04698 [Pestalotiopsis fici W106-1]